MEGSRGGGEAGLSALLLCSLYSHSVAQALFSHLVFLRSKGNCSPENKSQRASSYLLIQCPFSLQLVTTTLPMPGDWIIVAQRDSLEAWLCLGPVASGVEILPPDSKRGHGQV